MNINPVSSNFSRMSQARQNLNTKAKDLDSANSIIMGFKELGAFAAGLGLTRVSESNTGGPIVDLSNYQREAQLRTISQAA